MLFKMSLILILMSLISCQETEPLKSNDIIKNKLGAISQANTYSTVEFEIEMTGHGDDLQGDDSNLNSLQIISYQHAIGTDGFGTVNRIDFHVPAIENSTEDNNSLFPKYRKALLEKVRYTSGTLYATFNNQEEQIETDQYFDDTWNFLLSERQKLDQVLSELDNAPQQQMHNMSPQDYIQYLIDNGYNIKQITSQAYQVENVVETIDNEDKIVTRSYYNTGIGQYERQEMLLNDQVMYKNTNTTINENKVISNASNINLKHLGRNSSLKTTLIRGN